MSTGAPSDAGVDAPASGMPADSEIRWTLGPSPWPSTRQVLDLAIEGLAVVVDDLGAGIIEQMALALADREEEVRAVRTVLSAALQHSHAQDVEILRLRRRLADLLEARPVAWKADV